jgi:hypothetical protein
MTFTEAQATLTIPDGRITRNEADGGSGRGGGGDGQGVGGGVYNLGPFLIDTVTAFAHNRLACARPRPSTIKPPAAPARDASGGSLVSTLTELRAVLIEQQDADDRLALVAGVAQRLHGGEPPCG